MLLCFAPIILTGFMIPFSTPFDHTTLDHSPAVKVITCNTGLGAHALAARNGVFTGGVNYGFTTDYNGVEFSLMPELGISYVDHSSLNLPASQAGLPQYEVGLQSTACYSWFCAGLGFTHLSNGRAMGICPYGPTDCRGPVGNRGENAVLATFGFRFESLGSTEKMTSLFSW